LIVVMPQSRTKRYFARCFFVVLLLVVSVTAFAIPAETYKSNLQRAISALQRFESSSIEKASEADYQSHLDATSAVVRSALPEREDVHASDEICDVDNSWLHDALKELKTARVEDRHNKVTQIIERLQAIEERVGYEQRAATDAERKAATKQKLESILGRPEYETEARGPNALSRLLQDFINWIQQFLPKPIQLKPGSSKWVSIVARVLVVIIALVVLVFALKLLFGRFRGTKQKRAPKKSQARIVLGERLEPDETATDLLSEAEALARRGELRAAIRKAYIALLLELGDRKVITLAQHKTNRDYLNATRNLPPLHSRMRGLTDSFERHWYGFADATENDWQDFRAGYRAALQTGN
jgi:uncharacterized membrane protein